MSTRSTITIKSAFKRVDLYRHWDGYPEATGRHLARVLRQIEHRRTPEALVVALLTSAEGEPFGAGRYELTDRAEAHGDREWHYEITLHHDQEPELRVFHRPIGEAMYLAHSSWLSDYRVWISHRLSAFVARIKAFKARAA